MARSIEEILGIGRLSARLMNYMRQQKHGAKEGAAETLLHSAAWTGDIEQAKQQIANGANVNQVDSIGETALHGASAWGNTDMVRYLLSVGAQINIAGADGFTPLHWAAGWGNLQTVVVLISAGASKLATSKNGLTPEHVARQHNKEEIATYLCDA
jgi:uncharacterized protein